MIHYHGTPLTPREVLLRMAGKHFCVSFADPRDAEVCLDIGQSVMWDNGAFTAFTQGTTFDINAFYKWVEPRLGHPHWAVIPDEIGGDEAQNRAKLATWPFPKEFGAPVWHLHMHTDYLLYLCDNYPKVCFGSSGEYWKIGTIKWEQRIDAAFNAIAQHHRHLPWIHMLRGLSQSGKRWPFASADSVNVARNYKDSKADPEKMARRIDGIQCPIHWDSECCMQQMELAI